MRFLLQMRLIHQQADQEVLPSQQPALVTGQYQALSTGSQLHPPRYMAKAVERSIILFQTIRDLPKLVISTLPDRHSRSIRLAAVHIHLEIAHQRSPRVAAQHRFR